MQDRDFEAEWLNDFEQELGRGTKRENEQKTNSSHCQFLTGQKQKKTTISGFALQEKTLSICFSVH